MSVRKATRSRDDILSDLEPLQQEGWATKNPHRDYSGTSTRKAIMVGGVLALQHSILLVVER